MMRVSQMKPLIEHDVNKWNGAFDLLLQKWNCATDPLFTMSSSTVDLNQIPFCDTYLHHFMRNLTRKLI